jgi:hypothetical protein
MLFVKMFDPPSGNISLIKGAGVSLIGLIGPHSRFRRIQDFKTPKTTGQC